MSWDRKLLDLIDLTFWKIAVALLYIFRVIFIPLHRGEAAFAQPGLLPLPLAPSCLRAEPRRL